MFRMAKDTSINLRITWEFREDLQKLADYRGLSLSSLAHSILVKGLRAEKLAEPEAFQSERIVNNNYPSLKGDSSHSLKIQKQKEAKKKVG